VISIAIPAYKHAALTHEAASSVLQQDIDVELVILDDFNFVEPTAENLRSIESLRDYLHADPRVKCFSNDTQLPIQDNWNKTVSLCSGSYVKLIGADDRLLPNSLIDMEKMIKERPEVAFHGHLANVIDGAGMVVRRQRPYGANIIENPIDSVAALKGKLRQQVRFKEPVCNFYLKRAWALVGGYDKKYRFTFDVSFNVKMMSTFPVMLWNEYLVELRRHQASDGAQLPASLALTDLKGVVNDIGLALGSEYTKLDQAAADGLLQYRLIELMAQRLKRRPEEVGNLLVNNFPLFIKNPISYYWTGKFLLGRGMRGDVQQ